jgi:hypothetical protein
MMTMKVSRRRFIKMTTASVVATPLGVSLLTSAQAQDAPQLEESDPQAKALGYVHASAKEDQNCANCQLYTGAAGSEWGPCGIFPGKAVNAKGWCTAWVKKAG